MNQEDRRAFDWARKPLEQSLAEVDAGKVHGVIVFRQHVGGLADVSMGGDMCHTSMIGAMVTIIDELRDRCREIYRRQVEEQGREAGRKSGITIGAEELREILGRDSFGARLIEDDDEVVIDEGCYLVRHYDSDGLLGLVVKQHGVAGTTITKTPTTEGDDQ